MAKNTQEGPDLISQNNHSFLEYEKRNNPHQLVCPNITEFNVSMVCSKYATVAWLNIQIPANKTNRQEKKNLWFSFLKYHSEP